jgi:outer membrane protein OmpA-like peptidoglycan-associated protein
MEAKRYRLSKRGKVVVFLFPLFIIIAVFLFSNSFSNQDIPECGEVLNQDPVIPSDKEGASEKTTPINIKECTVSLYFEPGETFLTIESQSTLDLFLEIDLAEESKIRIEGNCATLHRRVLTDYERKINETFALRRAQEVAEYLQKEGLSSEHIEVISNGSDYSVNSNRTWAQRRLNRRVDIIFQIAE